MKKTPWSLKKKIVLALGGLFVLFVVLLVVGFELTSTPEFCASCHNMKPYVESWAQSSHNDVACATCHYPPGFFNYLKGKVTDGQVHLSMFLAGRSKGKYHAEISDLSCLLCHPRESLMEDKQFKGVSFSHSHHLDELRRSKKLRCVTCHGQIVQGEHFTVDERDCFICHFKPDEDGRRDPVLADCRTCHKEVPIQIAKGDHAFHHRRYIEDGIDCKTCHVGIIEGDAQVDYDRCQECHTERERTLREIVKTEYTTESYHLNHVTKHKVECWRCHGIITHKIVRNPTTIGFEQNCTTCHTEKQHLGARELYRGVGGIGVPDQPSKMFLSNVDCASCHSKTSHGNHATDMDYLSMGKACNSCHGPGYDSMLLHWKEMLIEADARAEKGLLKAEKMERDRPNAEEDTRLHTKVFQLLSDARHNIHFVRVARGHHNIEYALRLLHAAEEKSAQAVSLMDGSTVADIPPLDFSCTTLCHTEMETRKVKLGKTDYPHKTHVIDLGFDCTDCHGYGFTADHGALRLTMCDECHHGEGKGSVTCEDCHQEVANLIQGKTAHRAATTADEMNTQIECVDCHTQVTKKEKTTREEIAKTCVDCHEAGYGKKIEEWIQFLSRETKVLETAIEEAQTQIDARRKAGVNITVAGNILLMLKENMELIQGRRGLHNMEYARKIIAANKALLEEYENL